MGESLFHLQLLFGHHCCLQTRGFVLEPLPNAVYCVPFQPVREEDGVATKIGPMPPHGLTSIPARPVPAVQARKESRPLAFDKDGSQQLKPKAKPRGPSEPSGTRDPSAPACTPIMQSNTVSVCDLTWRALAAGHHFGKNVKPRPYMNLRNSQHLTTLPAASGV